MDKTFWSSVKHTEQKFESVNPLLRFLIGIGLIILGIVGIILPVMPGWIFLFPGIFLAFPFTKKWFNKE